jgi:hypothetical protein
MELSTAVEKQFPKDQADVQLICNLQYKCCRETAEINDENSCNATEIKTHTIHSGICELQKSLLEKEMLCIEQIPSDILSSLGSVELRKKRQDVGGRKRHGGQSKPEVVHLRCGTGNP